MHFFEGDAFCFGIERQHDDELHDRHHREKNEGIAAGLCGERRKAERNYACHEPVREAAEALSLGANTIGENFADVNPNDGALGKRKKRDVRDEQPDKIFVVPVGEEDGGDSGEAGSGADGADEEKFLTANFVDESHRDHREDEVGGADGDGLKVRRDFVEASIGEDRVQVIENGVDPGELVEHADGDSQENWQAVLRVPQRIVLVMLGVDGGDDFLKFGFVILFADEAKNISSFVNAAFLGEPARTARNAKKHGQEEDGRQSRDAELPAPFGGSKLKSSDDVVREIGEKDSEDDVELEKADEAAAPLRGRNFGDVHRAQDGRTADAEAADEAKNHECRPTPRKSTPDGGYDVKDCHETETVATADGIARETRRQRTDDGADERAGDRNTERPRRKVIEIFKRQFSAGNNDGIKSKKKTTQRGDDCALQESGIQHGGTCVDEIIRELAERISCDSEQPVRRGNCIGFRRRRELISVGGRSGFGGDDVKGQFELVFYFHRAADGFVRSDTELGLKQRDFRIAGERAIVGNLEMYG